MFLLEAFTRLANAYFLMVCILQSLPAITITNGVPTSLLPLGIVLVFDGTATAREDYKRHVDDAKANNSKSAWMCVLLGGVGWGGCLCVPHAQVTHSHPKAHPPLSRPYNTPSPP